MSGRAGVAISWPGFAYCERSRDHTASHFFIDCLPKGTYVFEYATRIQHRRESQTGRAEIQCMYPPEFNRHSESLLVNGKLNHSRGTFTHKLAVLKGCN